MLRLPDDTKIEMKRDPHTETITLLLVLPDTKTIALRLSVRKIAQLMLCCNEMLAGTGFDWDDRELRKKLG